MSLLAMPIRTPPHAVPLWQEALFLAYLGIAAAFTFLPTWVALWRRRSGAARIFLANLFLGWTVIGWVLALIFAFRDPERTVTEPYICRNCHTVSMPNLPGRQWFFGAGAWNAAKLYGALAPALFCPRCRAPNPVPLDTPAGREIAARSQIS
jgi:hypothetical protein